MKQRTSLKLKGLKSFINDTDKYHFTVSQNKWKFWRKQNESNIQGHHTHSEPHNYSSQFTSTVWSSKASGGTKI